jgi:hypothetical protein
MTEETKIILVMGSFAIMLICWAYYHCLMRQHEKYNALKKAFEDDFPNTWGDKRKEDFFYVPIEKPAKRPRLYKQATVVTKGELPRKSPVKTVAKKAVVKKTTTTKGKK